MLSLTNTNINKITPLPTPLEIKHKYPLQDNIANKLFQIRCDIQQVLKGNSKKFIVIVGPCSIHNTKEAMLYAIFLKSMIKKYGDKLLIIMRTYISKPRTCLGWKGFLYDPNLNGTYDIHLGLRESRKLFLEISNLGIPCAMEYLDTISPQYFDDILVWGAIGARTTESQIHRELCSAITTAVGFKNNLDGNIDVAINSIKCCSRPQVFLGCDENGQTSSIYSKGNLICHLILRGSNNGPNYDRKSIITSHKLLKELKIDTGIIIDCSHGNSGKDHTKQILGVKAIIEHLNNGLECIKGIMLESNLVEGSQNMEFPLQPGISITDSCIGLEETENILEMLYNNI